jgi:hypothetical protein
MDSYNLPIPSVRGLARPLHDDIRQTNTTRAKEALYIMNRFKSVTDHLGDTGGTVSAHLPTGTIATRMWRSSRGDDMFRVSMDNVLVMMGKVGRPDTVHFGHSSVAFTPLLPNYGTLKPTD